MDRIWDTSKCPPKPFVTLCEVKVIQGHEVKKVKLKVLGSSSVIHVFRSDFRQEQKKVPEYFYSGPNRTKFEKRTNADILVNSVKSGLFGRSKRQNSALFQDINLKLCPHVYR